MSTAFRLTDSTLRDGSHALSHRYTVEQVASIVRGLDAAGVPVIEVSHGDGLGGSSFNYGFSGTDERELVSAAVAAATTRPDRGPAAARDRGRRRPARHGRPRRRRWPGSPPTAPRPTSPPSTSAWPSGSAWRRSGS